MKQDLLLPLSFACHPPTHYVVLDIIILSHHTQVEAATSALHLLMLSYCYESCWARAGTRDSGTDLASAVRAAPAQLLRPGFLGVRRCEGLRRWGGRRAKLAGGHDAGLGAARASIQTKGLIFEIQ